MSLGAGGVLPVTHLDRRILDAWAATRDMHDPNPPAAPDSVTAAEREIGRQLPPAFHELYLVHDGGNWLQQNLYLYPLHDESELSVTNAAATYRGWEWPVPDEVVLFGNDGCGAPFGLWLPGVEARPLVVVVNAFFEPGCMGIVGQDLNAFLRDWTAYYLLPPDGTTTAGLDALDVPEELRSHDPDDAVAAQVRKWADPTLPSPSADPYEGQLTAADLHRIASTV